MIKINTYTYLLPIYDLIGSCGCKNEKENVDTTAKAIEGNVGRKLVD